MRISAVHPDFESVLAFADLSEFDDLDTLPTLLSGVYIIINDAGQPIYVGQSGDVQGRIRTHKRKRVWKDEIGTVLVKRLADADSRLVLETLLFMKYRPLHNRAVKLSKRKDGSLFEIQFLRGSTSKSTTRRSKKQAKSVKK
jgi:excinuclease UvrABC nuclease subunit